MKFIFKVNNAGVITCSNADKIIGGSNNFDTAFFMFDSSWNGLSKKVTFANMNNVEDTAITVLLDADNEVSIPAKPIAENGLLLVSVKGYNNSNSVVIATTTMKNKLYIVNNDYIEGTNTDVEVDLDLVEQLHIIADKSNALLGNIENALEDKLESLDANIDETIADKVDTIISDKVDTIVDDKLDNIDTYITSAITDKMSDIDDIITDKCEEIDSAIEQFEALDYATSTDLTNATSTIVTRIDGIDTQITSINSNNTTVNSKVSALESTTSTLNSSVSSLNTNVSSISSDVSSLNTNVSSISSSVSSITSRVSSIESKLDNVVIFTEGEEIEDVTNAFSNVTMSVDDDETLIISLN